MDKAKSNNDLQEMIDRYVDGQLSMEEIDELWVELIQDEEQIDYLKSVANLKKVIEDEEVNSEPNIHSLNNNNVNRNWMMAAAAAVLLLVGSLAVFNLVWQSDPIEPIASIELDYYRSADGTAAEEVGEEVIRNAIVLANQGEYEQAIELIDNRLAETQDPNLQAALNINAGSILYNTGNYEEAVIRFNNVVTIDQHDPLIRERAFWYLGNTYFQLNKLEDARDAFQQAYELNGAYSRVAQSYLRALAS